MDAGDIVNRLLTILSDVKRLGESGFFECVTKEEDVVIVVFDIEDVQLMHIADFDRTILMHLSKFAKRAPVFHFREVFSNSKFHKFYPGSLQRLKVFPITLYNFGIYGRAQRRYDVLVKVN